MEKVKPSEDALQHDFVRIPADFPLRRHTGTVSGTQPKLLMVNYEGKLYAQGCTPPEIFHRWQTCEDFAHVFVEKCRRNRTGKYSHLSETEILAQYCVRLLETGWASDEELRWVIRRTSELLGWPVPSIALPIR
jgi:hypothetical protein